MLITIVIAVTTAALLLLVAVAFALVAEKIGSGITFRRDTRFRAEATALFQVFLLEDISVELRSQEYRNLVLGYLIPLQRWTAPAHYSRRRSQRRVMKEVMLAASRDVAGETLVRLLMGFEALGFVQEELNGLTSRHWWIRAQSCSNLGLMKAQPAISPLLALLDDEEEVVRLEAAQAIIDIGGVRALTSMLNHLRGVTRWMSIRLSRAVLSMGRGAVPHILHGLRNENTEVQAFCIDMTGEIGDIRAVEPLINHITVADHRLTQKILRALGKLGDTRAIPLLRRSLNAPDESVRVAAAEALGLLTDVESADALASKVEGDSLAVQRAAANALGKFGATGIEKLEQLVGGGQQRGRLIAAEYLERYAGASHRLLQQAM